jgi:hypothetical protein
MQVQQQSWELLQASPVCRSGHIACTLPCGRVMSS